MNEIAKQGDTPPKAPRDLPFTWRSTARKPGFRHKKMNWDLWLVVVFLITTILAIIFIILKLAGAIALPWIWVLSPLWAPVVIFLHFLVIGLIALIIYESQERK
jgi:hypothetical protein